MENRFSNIVLDFARSTVTKADKESLPNIVEYIESGWGLNLRLFPVQRFILKAYYNICLDNKNKNIEVTDKFRENVLYTLTEEEYLSFLWNEGRININKLDPDNPRHELVLAIGRRGSKTAMSSFIASYEMYKLLMLDNPHKYYGLPEHNKIGVISVATDKEQAGLLFSEVSGHFSTCDLFAPYKEGETLSAIRLYSPHHLKKYEAQAKSKLLVTFKACVAKGLRGPGNIVIVLDEMAHFTNKGQASAEDVYKAITPSSTTFTPKDPNDSHKKLSELSDGRVISISSPLSDSGKFYELFQTAMSGGPASEGMLAIQAPCWEVNITLPSKTLRQYYYKDPEGYMTEYGAKFSGRTTKFIDRKEDLIACIVPKMKPKHNGIARKPYFMGIDVGLVDDGTAITITHEEDSCIELDYHDIRYAGKGKYKHVERLDIEKHIVDWVDDLCKSFYIQEGIFDQWHGIGIEQLLHKKNLRQFHIVTMTADLASRMYGNFLTLMYVNRLRLFDYPLPHNPTPGTHSPLITEILDLDKERKSKNIIVVKAPNIMGKHDDASDSLVRSIWLSSANSRGSEKSNSAKSKAHSLGTQNHTTYNSYHRKRAQSHGISPRSIKPNNYRR